MKNYVLALIFASPLAAMDVGTPRNISSKHLLHRIVVNNYTDNPFRIRIVDEGTGKDCRFFVGAGNHPFAITMDPKKVRVFLCRLREATCCGLLKKYLTPPLCEAKSKKVGDSFEWVVDFKTGDLGLVLIKEGKVVQVTPTQPSEANK